ncbi:hypothetical protein CDAR_431091 [Caerostris darwini]|uniref:Uncharacterized protein n=1 Tax=Caerostris darwini TaxID=1538125 RepID=A0AAV4SH09_9ARAC|nr:hypothetical protein CDAR_431091 [Caerostris darwini]
MRRHSVPTHFNIHPLPGRDSRPHPVMNRNLANPCDSSAGRCAKSLSPSSTQRVLVESVIFITSPRTDKWNGRRRISIRNPPRC